MAYSIRIKRTAARELEAIPLPARSRLAEAIDSLSQQPFQGSSLKGGLRGLRRLRVGDYRVVYELLDDELVVLVVRVAHRQGSYGRGKRGALHPPTCPTQIAPVTHDRTARNTLP